MGTLLPTLRSALVVSRPSSRGIITPMPTASGLIPLIPARARSRRGGARRGGARDAQLRRLGVLAKRSCDASTGSGAEGALRCLGRLVAVVAAEEGGVDEQREELVQRLALLPPLGERGLVL